MRCRGSWAVHLLGVHGAPELDRKHLPLSGDGLDWRVAIVPDPLSYLLLPLHRILRDVGIPIAHYNVR